MNVTTWLVVLTRAIAGALITQGKTDQAGLLNDLASAASAGRNVDDIMAEYAAKWQTEGEPSFEDIAAARQRIQERLT